MWPTKDSSNTYLLFNTPPTRIRKTLTVGTTALLLLAVAAVCADKETRPLAGPVTKVTSNSAVDVHLKALEPGQNSTITVEAPTGQLALVKTDVVDGALTVTLDPAAPATTNADKIKKIKVTVLLANITEVNNLGAGDAEIDVRIECRETTTG